jgi:hypothetical protein
MAIDRPKHRTFADAGELEPVLQCAHRAGRGIAAVRDDLQVTCAFPIGLAASHGGLEAIGDEHQVVATLELGDHNMTTRPPSSRSRFLAPIWHWFVRACAPMTMLEAMPPRVKRIARMNFSRKSLGGSP